jgi:hypothetical protein
LFRFADAINFRKDYSPPPSSPPSRPYSVDTSLALSSCSTSGDECSGESRVGTTGVEKGRRRLRWCREGSVGGKVGAGEVDAVSGRPHREDGAWEEATGIHTRALEDGAWEKAGDVQTRAVEGSSREECGVGGRLGSSSTRGSRCCARVGCQGGGGAGRQGSGGGGGGPSGALASRARTGVTSCGPRKQRRGPSGSSSGTEQLALGSGCRGGSACWGSSDCRGRACGGGCGDLRPGRG